MGDVLEDYSGLPEHVRGIVEERDRLRSVNADLLAALEEIDSSVRVTRATAEAVGRLNKGGEDAMQSLEVLADIARAAIARARGQSD